MRSPRRVLRPLYALTLLIGTGLAFLVVLSWFQPPAPARLVLIGSGYELNLDVPPHVAGRTALDRFARFASRSSPWSIVTPRSGRLELRDGAIELRSEEDWLAAVSGGRHEALLVFISAHCGADLDGPYLLPSGAGVEPASRIRFERVLDQLAGLPAAQNKILFLDCSRLEDHWALGMLHNDFVRSVAERESRIAAIPNLVVILSADVHQSSWDRGMGEPSAFSHYLMQSLWQGPRVGNGSFFTAWDLYVDVRDRVHGWVASHRGEDQTPLLLPRRGGEQRARRISLAFRLDAPPATTWADPLPAIETMWQRHEALRQETPAAVMRTPQLVRRWEALAQRYEELLLGGASDAAAEVFDQLSAAEKEMVQSQAMPWRSASTTLTMPAFAGAKDLDLPEPFAPFDQLWSSSPQDWPSVWSKLRAAERTDSGVRTLQRRICEATVRLAAEDPRRDLDRAAELMRFTRESYAGVFPVEPHFLLMLQRDMAAPMSEENAAVASQALRLRLLAERATAGVRAGSVPYSEYVLPWVQSALGDADDARRLGEDLTFATERDDLSEASRYLQEAERSYNRVIEDAQRVHFALEQYSQAFYELGHWSRWSARCCLSELREFGPLIIGLSKQAHELGDILAKPPSPAVLQDAKRCADNVHSGLAGLRDRLDELARSTISSSAVNSDTIAALLELPNLPLAVRMKLLSKRLQLEQRSLDGADLVEVHSAAPLSQSCRETALLRGEISLAAIGQRWFDIGMGADRESFDRVRQRLQTFGKESRWWESLARAADEMGDRWRRLVSEPDRLVNLAGLETDPDRIQSLLWNGDQLVRGSLGAQPAQAASVHLRDWLSGRSLAFQAVRMERDHWADDRAGCAPYYQAAAHELLRDARLISQRGSFSIKGLDELESRLGYADSLELQAPERTELTSGEGAQLAVALSRSDRAGATGFPVMWSTVRSASSDGDVIALSPLPVGRRTAMTVKDRTSEPLRLEVSSPLLSRLEFEPLVRPTVVNAEIVWSALHRGVVVERSTKVRLHACPDVVSASQPPPRNAAVSVSADASLLRRLGRARGALAIVLDCSGSMGRASFQAATEPTRFDLVSQALRELLDNTPPGTTVSLWVFGQSLGDDKTAESAEKTITRLFDPIAWTGEDSQKRDLMARVARLTPWNESPVLRTMLSARQDLTRVDGPRTLVVFTDGIDNRYARDREVNPTGESVQDGLRRGFLGTGISLHVIGFQVASHEDDEAHRQFSPVAEMDPAGTFSTVDDLGELLAAARPIGRETLQYSLVDNESTFLSGPSNAVSGTVDAANIGNRWAAIPLNARTRSFEFDLAPDSRCVGQVSCCPGDAISLRLVMRGAEVALRREVLADQLDLPDSRVVRRDNWVAAVPRYHRPDTNEVQMLLTLERDSDDENGPVRQLHPADLWVEVATPDNQALAIRWVPAAGYAAPAWRLDSPAWPTDVEQTPLPAMLRIWWLADHTAAPSVSLMRGRDFHTPAAIARRLRLDGSEIGIDSVSVERRRVGPPGPLKTGGEWAIVVRVSHAVGRPVRVAIDGVGAPRGQEHQYYQAAGKYVAIFLLSDATTQDAVRECLENDLRTLSVTSIAALCEEAEKEGHSAEFINLGKPAAESTATVQPVSLD